MKTAMLASAVLAALALSSMAHDEPTSTIDIRMTAVELSVEITASATDLAHDLPEIEPRMLMDEKTLSDQGAQLGETIASRIKIEGDGELIELPLRSITPLPEKCDLLMVFSRDWRAAPSNLRVEADLFPYDPRHRTFVNVHSGGEIIRQFVLTADQPVVSFATTGHQGLGATVVTFIKEGIHHIFIGPDHILFIVALLLLGGGLPRLLMIVTAFTVAHSITLVLATFRILSPPADIIEPVIALSIVVVGIHAFVGSSSRDPRLVFAFCFGLIHGFGFANVLQEMVLPREALALSLFAFNFGVEIGQALILLAIAPLLSLFRMAYPKPAGALVSAGALAVTSIGAFWFFQRIGG